MSNYRLVMIGGLMAGSLFCTDGPILFNYFPKLAHVHPYKQFGNWPTPILHAKNGGNYLGTQKLFIKREDLAADFVGANKIRKLEWLLPKALHEKYDTVLTYGGFASNHMVATAACAQMMDMRSIGLLMRQPDTANLQRNILLDCYYGCQLFECPGDEMLSDTQLKDFLTQNGIQQKPCVFPLGGSNAVGVIGMVNAVFELNEQIKNGEVPEPDYIYVPFGSMGTTAGLLLGVKLLTLKTKIKPIRITKNALFTVETLRALIQDANDLLHAADQSVPLYDWSKEQMAIVDDFVGQGYASPTQESLEAYDLLQQSEHIILDQSYTAKAAAALIHDYRAHLLSADDTVLFWYTYCADAYAQKTSTVSLDTVPAFLHSFLTKN